MKITMEHENGVYSVEEKDATTILDALELVERLLICAGFAVEPGSIFMQEKESK